MRLKIYALKILTLHQPAKEIKPVLNQKLTPKCSPTGIPAPLKKIE